jgi:hypothetical protein
MDFDENTHDSIILITGHGDNTKIKLKVKWFAEIGEEYTWMLIAEI